MIRRLSPAKVNLHLRVLQKRADGYHDLATLMQGISLYDEMTFLPAKEKIVIRCPNSQLPEDSQNIVYRAAEAFFSLANLPSSGIEIIIEKHIPVAAGLGGGSSNAAVALATMNEISGTPLSAQTLMELGARLGADVPFFLFGKTAWAFGIGDQLEVAQNVPFCWFVLINPGFSVSTKKVYEALNFRLTKEIINYSIPRFLEAPDLAAVLHNDLESVTLKLYPELNHLKELLLRHGANGALMAGSGPTVFGIFHQETAALEAAKALRDKQVGLVFTAHSI
jgi:4-diphosphocytidyl-2-C-methyl-D-erythritol kinase